MIDNEKVQELMLVLEDKLDKTANVLREEYTNIRAGRANPHVLDKITVDYYGTPSPLNQVGNISVADAKCLVISPWDTGLLKGIEKAILQSNIGLNPTNDGKVIRLIFPDLTEERRRETAKQIRGLAEEAKDAARNTRREAMDSLKKMKNAKEISEDECAVSEKDVEKVVSKCMERIEKHTAEKEKEIMSV